MQDALWDFEPDGAATPAGGQRPTDAGRVREPARRGFHRRGLDECPRCGQPVEVFALAMTGARGGAGPAGGAEAGIGAGAGIAAAEGGVAYDAVVPGEYPSARVPEEAARHLVRGRLWPGRDPGGWSRICHRAVCPDEAMPEDPELLAMWRTLRVRRRARAEAADRR